MRCSVGLVNLLSLSIPLGTSKVLPTRGPRNLKIICSIDYAKQEEVRERVWQQRWDLIIIDEAHKCSAYTKHYSGKADEVEKTKRYQLAERLTYYTDHLLMLTATPHHGDDDRFGHFIRLIDPDIFPEPHKVGVEAKEIRKDILRLGPDCPWALRRLKEDLKDLEGKRLFPDRHAQTVTFRLNQDEYNLYKAVTAYINEFLGQAAGRKKQSVALARTVIQRRLASSTRAIFESLKRRLDKQSKLLEELELLSPAQRARRLAIRQGLLPDNELDEDDLDEEARDILVDEFTTATELDQIRTEIASLKDLVDTGPAGQRPGRGLQIDRLEGMPDLFAILGFKGWEREADDLYGTSRHPQAHQGTFRRMAVFNL